MTLPVRLGKPPLVEMLFEVRFSKPYSELSESLPKKILDGLGGRYDKFGTLAAAGLPRSIREENPDLRYLPSHSLSGDLGVITVGERAITLSTTRYPGWSDFRGEIESLLSEIKGLASELSVERYSLKASNLVEGPTGEQLSFLALDVRIRGESVGELGFRLQVELPNEPLTTLLVVQTGARAISATSQRDGVILVVDSICKVPRDDFLDSPAGGLNVLHDEQRKVFFRLISDESLRDLNPEYSL